MIEDELQQIGNSSIKLIKNTKGYSWEIKIYDEDVETMLKQIKEADEAMKRDYS